MTLEEAILEVYTRTDEQSDLDPYVGGVVSLTAPGALLIRNALNQAQRVISTWKFPNGVRMRFRANRRESLVYSLYPSVTILGWDSNKTLTWAVAGAADSAYRFGVLELEISGTSYEYLILDSTATTCLIGAAPPSDPSGIVGNVRLSRYEPNVSPGWIADDYISPIEFLDISSRTILSRGQSRDSFSTSLLNSGSPSQWTIDGPFVVFNAAPQEQQYFLMRYYGYPAEVTSLTDSFALPEAFHEAIVQWACWWAYRRISENTSAYAQMRTLSDLMSILRTEADFDQDTDSGRLTYTG